MRPAILIVGFEPFGGEPINPALEAARRLDGRRIGGFIHVPYLPEQAARLGGQSSMALETMVLGLEAAIRAAIATEGAAAT